MKAEEWIRDPVFQLNLLIWMAMDQPKDGYCVRPFFHEHGFAWLAVEQPFQFPVETAKLIEQVIEQRGLQIHRHPEPELVLKREDDRFALYFEAKANSFGSASDTSDQARGHLLATGSAFAEVMSPLEKALLAYVVPHSAGAAMAACLKELHTQLIEAKLEPGEHSVCGLGISQTDLAYHLDSASQVALKTTESMVIVMGGLSDDTDPSPLMLVYSDQDCPDTERRGYYRRVLQNQVVANLLCDLHRAPVTMPVVKSASEILETTSQGVFSFLGRERKKGMERLVRENVFRKIHDYWKDRVSDLVQIQGKTLILDFKDEPRKSSFLDWLEGRRIGFEDSKPVGDELDQMNLPLV